MPHSAPPGKTCARRSAPITGVVVARGAWTDWIQLRYGSDWASVRGGSGGTPGPTLSFDGSDEFVTEAYVQTGGWHLLPAGWRGCP
jgi:hypothetical protein